MPKTYEQLDLLAASMPGSGVKQAVKNLFSPGAAPEQKTAQVWHPGGWLEPYAVIRCKREYWYWRYCWRDDTGKVKHKHVTHCKVPGVRYLLGQRSPVESILLFLKRAPGL
ncbi:hypothetical protein [Pseudanabaena sp. PCC 6802]|uniref:hypothetical protein n=1 Tax=Pseudanabaena sp. PCC 6802 TaxID=118173 RepID=UPI00034ACA9E|nr:hypothetical protein [Pseudanabaena sp. PCC 6802]